MAISSTVLPFGRHYGIVHRQLELDGLCLSDISAIPGAEVPTHTHEVAHFCLVVWGSYLNYVDGVSRARLPLSVIYYPPGSTHPDRIHPEGGRCFTIGLAPATFAKLDAELSGVEDAVVMDDEDSVWLTAKLYREFLRADENAAALLRGLAVALSGHVIRCTRRCLDGPPAWLRDVAAMIRTRCRDGAQLQELAAEVGVHPVHLSRAFRRQFGLRPSDYLRRCRIENAMELLHNPTISVGQAAVLSGYADQSSFARSFKRVTGLTPGEFRRKRSETVAVQSGPKGSTLTRLEGRGDLPSTR